MDPLLAGDIIYYMFLFGGFAFVVWFIPKAYWEWTGYLRKKFQLDHERILLEIRTPREVRKTPLAMELVFNGLFEPAGGEWFTWMTTGKSRPYYSFEIASIGGEVHFYIWAQRDYKQRIEGHFYAQYPDVELVEVRDYTKFDFSWDTHKAYGFEFKLAEADPIPIKTYRHHGFDRGGLEPEEQIDPITQTIETMANIGPHEQMWVQMVARGHKDHKTSSVRFGERISAFFKMFTSFDTKKIHKNFWIFFTGKKKEFWSKEAEELVQKIRDKYKTAESDTTRDMTRADRLQMEIIQENVAKVAWDVGIRSMYVAPKEHFNGGSVNHMMGSIFKQYSSGGIYNDLRPGLIPSYTFPWQDRSGKKKRRVNNDMFHNYRRRNYLHDDIEHYPHGKNGMVTFVLSSEEMATIFHLPGQVAQTPTFERIESVTGQAPANLPT